MERRAITPTRAFVILFVLVLLFACLGGGFVGGVATDRAGILPGKPATEPASAQPEFGTFWEAWDLVEQKYVDREAIKPKQMTYGAIEGMLDSLGDLGHTRFLSPQDLQAEQQSLSGQLEGIGAEMATRNGRPTVVAPIPGSPAQRAGIRAGDVVVAVDGQDITGLSLPQLTNLVRGPAGTTVTISVIHAGETVPVDIKIVRAKIALQSVEWVRLPGTGAAHILIREFDENVTQQLIAALKDAQAAGATSLVLDLRNNPGGLRDEAIGVASQFLRDGNVYVEQDAQGHRNPVPVKPGGTAVDTPLAVLINEGSASAAEIVAGALQDHRRGPLIGATTFGTGTVLSTYQLSDGSAILLGTLEWLTPSGRQIWRQGITPDIKVSLPNNAVPLLPDEESTLSPQALQSSQDAQLLRAIQELSRR